MVKISIGLPNHAEINVEAEDADQLLPVVNMVRQELLQDLARLAMPANGSAPHNGALDQSFQQATPPTAVGVAAPATQPTPATPAPPADAGPDPAQAVVLPGQTLPAEASPAPAPAMPFPSLTPPAEASPDLAPPVVHAPSLAPSLAPTSSNAIPPAFSNPRLTRDFADFCRNADPIGDMRKVVAAAEGARRHLSMDNVDAWELGQLFDLAGWTRAHNFTQTLRNAARHKFKWLERAPGRAGRYAATEKGREVVLGKAKAQAH